jgi:hypothetical protein
MLRSDFRSGATPYQRGENLMNLIDLKPNNLFSQRKFENTIVLIRKITICIIAVILTAIVFGQGFTQSNAAVTKQGSGTSATYITNGTEYPVSALRNRVFGAAVLDMAYSAYGGGLTAFQKDLLIINTEADYWGTLQTAYNSIAAVGAGLALLWCMLELIEKSSQGHITGEFILQLGIKFTIAAVVISEGGRIAEGVINLANGITYTLSDAFTTSLTEYTKLDEMFVNVYKDIKDANIFGCIGAMFPLILSALMMKICTIIIFALLAGRILEVGVRYMFFPIGASDVFTHGMGSPGFRYVKKLFAASLQGIAMYAVVFIGQMLMSSASSVVGSTTTLAGGLVVQAVWPIIVGFSVIGAMLKVSSIVNDIAG